MSSAEHEDLPVVNPAAAPCRHLRSKGMYIYTDGLSGDEHDDDSTVFWCLQTMKGFGPDDETVGRDDCRSPGRPCYEPL